MPPRTKTDRALEQALDLAAGGDRNYWTCRARGRRPHAHALFQYPAMMVPQVQARLIEVLRSVAPSAARIIDPFAGSGTVLTEAMSRGFAFTAIDINPLAVLLCRVKSGPGCATDLEAATTRVLARIRTDRRRRSEVAFPGRDKWFSREVTSELSRIRRAAMAEDDLWCRRFLWVALAETVRRVSNSRTSTYKLHIRPAGVPSPATGTTTKHFADTLVRNILAFRQQWELLDSAGLLRGGAYRQRVTVHLGDVAAGGLATRVGGDHDLLITSPPYGDNASTVPYGQYSYLPLQWIPLTDIDVSVRDDCLATTLAIDGASLGGSRVRSDGDVGRLSETSPAFGQTVRALADVPPDRARRVSAFCIDLDAALDGVLPCLRDGAYMAWVVGNRHVGGRPVPLDRILAELLLARGAYVVTEMHRDIPQKRMATRNGISDTIRRETILVARKGGR